MSAKHFCRYFIISLSFLLAFFLTTHSTSLQAQNKGTLPLREKSTLDIFMFVYNADVEDYFYSTSLVQLQEAILQGYDDYPSPEKIGVVGYLEKTQQDLTAPLYGLYKGAPSYNHFYSANITELNNALSQGYEKRAIVGYIYLYAVPGVKPLYRLHKLNAQTQKLTHFYTTLLSEITELENRGYISDGIIGYIQESATNNLNPDLESGRITGRRCGENIPFCGGETYRDYYYNLAINAPTLFKPGSMNYHEISFDFTTWNGLGIEMGHSAIMLRGEANFDQNDLLSTRFDGVGIIVGSYACPENTGGNRFAVELWRPDTGTNGQAYVDCEMLSPPIQMGQKYKVVAKSYNDGTLYYAIYLENALFFEISKNIKNLYENMGGIYRPFPQPEIYSRKNTKYSIVHSNDAKYDFTLYFEDLKVNWRY